MLGVARVSVTLALRDLEEEGLISTSRKIVKIDNRAGLLAKVTQYYGGAEREYIDIMNARMHK